MAYDDGILRGYYKKSYFSVDGLWFMKTEEAHGFEEALRLDADVWEVLAKLQARKTKELLKIKGNSVADLVAALELKWTAEEYEYEVKEAEEDRGVVLLRSCPWLRIMEKAGRTHLTQRIGECVCPREYAAWAKEINPRIRAEIKEMLCRDGKPCRLSFKTSNR